jgi:predicted kinase
VERPSLLFLFQVQRVLSPPCHQHAVDPPGIGLTGSRHTSHRLLSGTGKTVRNLMARFPLLQQMADHPLLTAFFERPAKPRTCDLVVIRGAPGVGKSTLANGLKARFPQGVTIEVDAFKGMMHRWDWKDTRQYRHITGAAGMACSSYLENGYSPVIAVDTFSPEILGEFMALMSTSPRKPACLVITLVCDPEILALRIQRRKTGLCHVEPALAINDHMGKSTTSSDLLVDTGTRSPDEVLALVLERI